MRLTEFWARMREQFGDAYSVSVAKDHVFARLGDKTIEQALAEGQNPKTVWRAVTEEFEVPRHLQ
ncbi:MAG TPA: DUF3046 domain-containing protein [Streptosporangiaceae bacterium]|nr:DUF3046 domain-containing protein [Streptosporangiaceae bacterium]